MRFQKKAEKCEKHSMKTGMHMEYQREKCFPIPSCPRLYISNKNAFENIT